MELIGTVDSKLERNYKNFKEFLKEIEKELKSGYNKSNEAIIHLKFKMVKDTTDNYCIDCEYFINDKDKKEDNEFKDENILNIKNKYYIGLNYLINRLNDD